MNGDDKSPSVELRGVTKRFGDVTAVDGLEPSRSGRASSSPCSAPAAAARRRPCGWSRASRSRPRASVLIDGSDVAGLPAHKRPTNTVFQSYALFPHLSVEDNVAFGLRRKKVDKAEIERRVAAELERVGLAREAKRRPNQLSGGQQQRVALARALVNLPKVLLLDEPLGALDLKLRKGLQVELKRIQRDVGITFLYVTHDQEEALTMSDRIAVMNDGRVEQVAGPEEIYERPATTFVAGFIGVSNLMPATVDAGGEVRLDTGPTVRGRRGQRFPAGRALLRGGAAGEAAVSSCQASRIGGDLRVSRERSRARSTWAPRRRSSSTSATRCG